MGFNYIVSTIQTHAERKRGEVLCRSRLGLVGKSQLCMKRHERKGDENDGESTMIFFHFETVAVKTN